MQTQITLPILIIRERGIIIVDDLAEAESMFRLDDVGSEEFKVYDGTGNVMVLRGWYEDVARGFFFVRWKVEKLLMDLSLKDPIENQAEIVKLKLIEFIKTSNMGGSFIELDKLALPELIEIASKYP